MRYKELIQRKLESIYNLTMSLDSLISSNASQQELRSVNERIKGLVDELESLIQKEA